MLKDTDKVNGKRLLGGLRSRNDDVYLPFSGEDAQQVIIPLDENLSQPGGAELQERPEDFAIRLESDTALSDAELEVQRVGETNARVEKYQQKKEKITESLPEKIEPFGVGGSELAPLKALSYLLGFFDYAGRCTLSFFAYCAIALEFVLLEPAKAVFKNLLFLFGLLGKKIKSLPKTTLEDYRRFAGEARFVREKAGKLKGTRRFPVFKALSRYYVRSFTRYNRFWQTTFNVGFPFVAVLVLVFTINYRQSTTVALEISCNGQVVGYAENEQVFNDAKSTAVRLLSVGGGSEPVKLSDAVYSIKRVSLNQLNDASVISENLIKSSEKDYVQACGIFIDGSFVCAVKNEADAVAVFDNILEGYRKKENSGAKVGFVEQIDYVQGLYADTKETVFDAEELEKKITSKKKKAVYYTVKPGDSLSGIAYRNDLTVNQLKSMNPKLANDNIYAGDTLVVSQQVNYVRVKVMKTEYRNESIPYKTQRKDNSTLYKGVTKTAREGSNGTNRITELVTYIDGVRTYTSHISTKQIKAPVDRIVYVGTKVAVRSYGSYSSGSRSNSGSRGGSSSSSSSSGTYATRPSSRGFSWPTVGAYRISSPYGYRSLNGRYKLHGGVDIVRSGGRSAGLPVIASAPGTVVGAGYSGSYGYMVLIDHGGGYKTRYAHMTAGSICVSVGRKVSRGQQIGRIGSTGRSTGPHLHFEVIVNGNRVNPLGYLR